jgi:hypothetical protein
METSPLINIGLLLTAAAFGAHMASDTQDGGQTLAILLFVIALAILGIAMFQNSSFYRGVTKLGQILDVPSTRRRFPHTPLTPIMTFHRLEPKEDTEVKPSTIASVLETAVPTSSSD